jgi:hypothetical protein
MTTIAFFAFREAASARPVAFHPHLRVGWALVLIANDFGSLPSGQSPREASYRHFEAIHLHGYIKNGWSGNYLVRLLSSFYHNSADVNKKIQGALSGNFIDPDAKVLFRVRIVLRKSGVADSSIPYGWVNGLWPASDLLKGLSLKTTSLRITIGKDHRNGGNQAHWF